MVPSQPYCSTCSGCAPYVDFTYRSPSRTPPTRTPSRTSTHRTSPSPTPTREIRECPCGFFGQVCDKYVAITTIPVKLGISYFDVTLLMVDYLPRIGPGSKGGGMDFYGVFEVPDYTESMTFDFCNTDVASNFTIRILNGGCIAKGYQESLFDQYLPRRTCAELRMGGDIFSNPNPVPATPGTGVSIVRPTAGDSYYIFIEGSSRNIPGGTTATMRITTRQTVPSVIAKTSPTRTRMITPSLTPSQSLDPTITPPPMPIPCACDLFRMPKSDCDRRVEAVVLPDVTTGITEHFANFELCENYLPLWSNDRYKGMAHARFRVPLGATKLEIDLCSSQQNWISIVRLVQRDTCLSGSLSFSAAPFLTRGVQNISCAAGASLTGGSSRWSIRCTN